MTASAPPDDGQRVVVHPKDTGEALVNPGMGWALHFYDNELDKYGSKLAPSDTVDDYPGLSVVYLRLAWSYIEPEEGKFNWSVVDTPAQRWIAKGKQVAFRFCCTDVIPYSTPEWVEKARFWSQQARDPALWYEHSELGYNYRMSNVLAGRGRGQLEVLDLRVQQRRGIAFRYRDAFEDLPGISLMPQAPYGLHTNWLSCFLIDEQKFGCSRDELIQALHAAKIESRPVWKPMHLQPLYAGAEHYGGEVAEDLFRRGICLPSSSCLSPGDQMYVINQVRKAVGAPPLTAEPERAMAAAG